MSLVCENKLVHDAITIVNKTVFLIMQVVMKLKKAPS